MEFEIDPEVLRQMRELIGDAPPTEAPFYLYWAEADILEVFCGDPPCDSSTPVYMSYSILKGVSVIRKSYPEDIRNDDSFAGLEIWGGIADFLSHLYRAKRGAEYESFRIRFNETKQEIPVKEIVEAILVDPRGLVLPRWSEWQERVMRALTQQNPMVHIPLLKL